MAFIIELKSSGWCQASRFPNQSRGIQIPRLLLAINLFSF